MKELNRKVKGKHTNNCVFWTSNTWVVKNRCYDVRLSFNIHTCSHTVAEWWIQNSFLEEIQNWFQQRRTLWYYLGFTVFREVWGIGGLRAFLFSITLCVVDVHRIPWLSITCITATAALGSKEKARQICHSQISFPHSLWKAQRLSIQPHPVLGLVIISQSNTRVLITGCALNLETAIKFYNVLPTGPARTINFLFSVTRRGNLTYSTGRSISSRLSTLIGPE